MSNVTLIANWKMNPKTSLEAKKIFSAVQKDLAKMNGVDACICVPTIYLPELSKLLKSKKISLGVQDIFYEGSGAYTGQISPEMVKPFKVTHTILGHSERRELGESNEFVARKVHYAMKKGMNVVLCVGERERTDEGGYFTFVRDELETVLSGIKRADLKKLIIAYEPIWAIGKRAEEALDVSSLYEMVLFIRKILTEHFGRAPALKVPILYGAAVKVENAGQFIAEGGVNGLLVGSASLDSKQFIGISKAVLTKK